MQDPEVIVGRVLQRRCGADRERRAGENHGRKDGLAAPALQDEIRRCDSEAEQNGAVQIRPEREERQQ